MTYLVEEVQAPEEEDADDPSWDALDWCYMVKASEDDIICICATKEEADHIAKILNANPYPP